MSPFSDKPQFYYVYILRSKKDGRWYSGYTSDLRKRFKEHNNGNFKSWTKGRGPFELIYYEAYLHPKDAWSEEDRLDAPFGVDFYLWMPVPDHTAPKHDQLEFGVSALEQLVAMGKAEAFVKTKRPPVHLAEVQREALQNFSKNFSFV